VAKVIAVTMSIHVLNPYRFPNIEAIQKHCTDLRLVVDQGQATLHAHKVMLAASCNTMAHDLDLEEDVVLAPEFSLQAAEAALNYLYGQRERVFEEAEDLLVQLGCRWGLGQLAEVRPQEEPPIKPVVISFLKKNKEPEPVEEDEVDNETAMDDIYNEHSDFEANMAVSGSEDSEDDVKTAKQRRPYRKRSDLLNESWPEFKVLTTSMETSEASCVPCPLCNVEVGPRRDQAVAHVAEVHHPSRACVQCGYIGKDSTDLSEHWHRAEHGREMRRMSPLNHVKCKACMARVENADMLRRHKLECHIPQWIAMPESVAATGEPAENDIFQCTKDGYDTHKVIVIRPTNSLVTLSFFVSVARCPSSRGQDV